MNTSDNTTAKHPGWHEAARCFLVAGKHLARSLAIGLAVVGASTLYALRII